MVRRRLWCSQGWGCTCGVPGVDAERFAEAVQSQGILGYIDTLSGGSISRVGIFSLGTIPTYKNSWLRQDVSLP